MTKLLFLIHDLGYGGAEKVLVNLANNLDKTKYDVTIQTLFDVGENRQFLSDDVHYIGGLKKIFRGNAPLMRSVPAKLLTKMVIKEKYDIVIAFLEGPDTRIVSAYPGKKIAWVHTDFADVNQAVAQYRSYDEMCKCYNSFDIVACVAKNVKEKFNSLLELKVPCQVVYNVNDTNSIVKKAEEQQTEITKQEDTVNIISVGKLIPLKGYDKLIRIHKKLLEEGLNNCLYILGEGPEHQKLQNIIDENELQNSCKLLGFNENPYKFVKNADLFVCSSEREGFSTAVTEALVLGIPVVSTNVSGANELLGDNNEYGIVTDIDEDSLYKGVYSMLTEDSLLEYYKKQAEIRGKEFSTEKTTKTVEEILESIV